MTSTSTSGFFSRVLMRGTSASKSTSTSFVTGTAHHHHRRYSHRYHKRAAAVAAAVAPDIRLRSTHLLPASCCRVTSQPQPQQPQPQTFPAIRRASLTTRSPPGTRTTIPTTTTPVARFHTSSPRTNMSSDADYAAFLDKANQDTGGATTQSSDDKKQSYGTKSVNTAVPEALQSVEEYYVSDADEPFEPVALKFEGGKEVSADELKKLLGHGSDVSETAVKTFESQYKKVVDAVKKAGNGEVKAFRVEHGSTRAEYYVVSVDEKEGRIVGLKALSVES